MALFNKKKTEKTEQSGVPEKAENQDGSRIKSGMTNTSSRLSIEKPHVTEKTLRMSKEDTYVFIAPRSMSKVEAAKQIEKLYNVTCLHARVTAGSEKKKVWRGKAGKSGSFKKIIVTLKKGQKIELTGQA